MPFKCCVRGCNSNYKNQNKMTVFSFPKDKSMREKWLDCINRKDYIITASSRICMKHFPEDFIVREKKVIRPDGSLLVVPRERVRLAFDAYPVLIKNQSFLSPLKPNTINKNNLLVSKRPKESGHAGNLIDSFEVLTKGILDKLKTDTDLNDLDFKIFSDKVFIYHLKKSVVISRNLNVTFLYENCEIYSDSVKSILGDVNKCDTWTKFINFLKYVKYFQPKNGSNNEPETSD